MKYLVGEGVPYVGNDIRMPGANEQTNLMCGNSGEVKGELILLTKQRCEKEGIDRERQQQEMNRMIAERQVCAPNTTVGRPNGAVFCADGISNQRNGNIMVTQTIHMFPIKREGHRRNVSILPGLQMSQSSHETPHGPMTHGNQMRRNSCFRAGNFHTGGQAPSGRTTPDFRNGQRDGWSGAERKFHGANG